MSVGAAALQTGNETCYLFYRRLGGSQVRSVQVRKISHPPMLELHTVQPLLSRYTD